MKNNNLVQYPNLSLAQLEQSAIKFPKERKELLAEIAQRKIGRPKPHRYQVALDNYTQAVKALEDVIKKTDLNILGERLHELNEDCHEYQLIRKEFSEDRLRRRYPEKFQQIEQQENDRIKQQ